VESPKGIQDKTFAALSSDIRRQILVHLSSEKLTLTQIKQRFEFTGPAILYHLRLLEDGGFIVHETIGASKYYVLKPDTALRAFHEFLVNVLPSKPARRVGRLRPLNEECAA
jgi:DNA-binding transcriptional ArsR family regulator